jgi:hypothetical protein
MINIGLATILVVAVLVLLGEIWLAWMIHDGCGGSWSQVWDGTACKNFGPSAL